MEKSFGKDEKGQVTEGETTAVAKSEETAVAVNRPVPKVLQTKARGFEGEVTTAEIITPYISLVGKTGDLSDEFDPGSFVYDKSTEICNKNESFDITLIKAKLVYVEDLDYEDKSEPEVFNSLREAMEAGFHNEWSQKDDGKYVKPRLDCVVLFEVSEELSAHEFEGKHYALGAWSFQNSNYTKAGKKMVNALTKGWLREGVYLGTWKMSSVYETGGEFKYYHCLAKRGEMHTPEFIQFLEDEVLMD